MHERHVVPAFWGLRQPVEAQPERTAVLPSKFGLVARQVLRRTRSTKMLEGLPDLLQFRRVPRHRREAFGQEFLLVVARDVHDVALDAHVLERGNGPKDGLRDEIGLAQAQDIIEFGVPKRGHDHQELSVLP